MLPLSTINLSLYTYESIITEIVDADSLWARLDRGFGDTSLRALRLNRINAPEIRGESKKLGYLALDFLKKYIEVGSLVTIESIGWDSFGRLICEVWLPGNSEWINLSDLLVENGHAVYVEYSSSSKLSFTSQQFSQIQ